MYLDTVTHSMLFTVIDGNVNNRYGTCVSEMADASI